MDLFTLIIASITIIITGIGSYYTRKAYALSKLNKSELANIKTEITQLNLTGNQISGGTVNQGNTINKYGIQIEELETRLSVLEKDILGKAGSQAIAYSMVFGN